VDLLGSKADALAQRFDRLGAPPPGSLVRGPSGAMFEVGAFYEICGIKATLLLSANLLSQVLSMLMQCKPMVSAHNNPFSNTYNPSWRNHLNFSYRNNNPMPPNTSQPQPPGFQYRAPYAPPPQQQPPSQNPIWRALQSAS